jgi:hypothetical protein
LDNLIKNGPSSRYLTDTQVKDIYRNEVVGYSDDEIEEKIINLINILVKNNIITKDAETEMLYTLSLSSTQEQQFLYWQILINFEEKGMLGPGNPKSLRSGLAEKALELEKEAELKNESKRSTRNTELENKLVERSSVEQEYLTKLKQIEEAKDSQQYEENIDYAQEIDRQYKELNNNLDEYLLQDINKFIGEGFHTMRGSGMAGEGIGDFFKGALNTAKGAVNSVKEVASRIGTAISGARKHAPPQVRDFIASHGNDLIDIVYVCRKPIVPAIDKVLNLISLGTWSKGKKEMGYDEMFHLYFIIKLVAPDRRTYSFKLEKNQVVTAYESDDISPVHEIVKPRNTTLRTFIENGEKYQGETFWLYNPSTNNCQVFVMSVLSGNGLSTVSLKTFVLQDATNILTGYAKSIGTTITDLASRADILLHGSGILYL